MDRRRAPKVPASAEHHGGGDVAGDAGDTLRRASGSAERAADSRWVDRAARLGFVGRGAVYIIIGVLAVQIATGDNRGQQANKQGALQAIADKPFGEVLLVALAVGLAGYALWRFTEAIWGKQDEHDEKKRTAKRLGSAGKGLLYALFCVSTISVLMGGGKGGGGEQKQKTWTAKVLDWPGGQLLVGLVGAVIIAGGAYLVYRGLARKFRKQLDESRMGESTRKATTVLGAVGITARGVVFGFAGALLIKAAVDYNPDEAHGIDGTLRAIAGQTYGQFLLSLAAIGLIVFGVYSFVEARYRKL
jgi:hypothetical protein